MSVYFYVRIILIKKIQSGTYIVNRYHVYITSMTSLSGRIKENVTNSNILFISLKREIAKNISIIVSKRMLVELRIHGLWLHSTFSQTVSSLNALDAIFQTWFSQKQSLER